MNITQINKQYGLPKKNITSDEARAIKHILIKPKGFIDIVHCFEFCPLAKTEHSTCVFEYEIHNLPYEQLQKIERSLQSYYRGDAICAICGRCLPYGEHGMYRVCRNSQLRCCPLRLRLNYIWKLKKKLQARSQVVCQTA